MNFVGLNRVLHYGAPSTIEDYFQESGRAGRSGELSTSTIMWKPSDAPLWKDLSRPRHAEIAAVQHYLENNKECRREQLLHHFDRSMQVPSPSFADLQLPEILNQALIPLEKHYIQRNLILIIYLYMP